MGRKSKEQLQLEELQKYITNEAISCKNDSIYFAENYCKVYDRTNGGYVDFKVFETQKRILNALQNHDFTLFLKYRQAGISTVCALHAAKELIFADSNNPVKICVVANKLSTAQEFFKKVIAFCEQSPAWWPVKHTKKNRSEYVLDNGSEIRALGTSSDALRGYTPNWIIIDEAAEIPGGKEFYDAALPAVSTGGRMTLISTPKGHDPLFHATYYESKRGRNDFHVETIYWWEDPRYTVDPKKKFDLVWQKEGEGDKVVNSIEDRHKLYKNKWRPTSSWYKKMVRQFKNDMRAVNQEINCSFLGSSATFVSDETITEHDIQNVREPDAIDQDNFYGHAVWLWRDNEGENENPNAPFVRENGVYIIGADVSSGSSDDFSTAVVFNMHTGNQVAEYRGKIDPDNFGSLLMRIGMYFNGALVAVDSGGGWGQTTLVKLRNENYPNLYYSLPKSKHIQEQFSQNGFYNSNTGKAPGLNTGPYRTLILTEMRRMLVNHEVKIRSKRIIEELHTFVDNGSRPDHMRGKHDDLIIAMGIGCYVYSFDYQTSEKSKEHTKAMLKAMKFDRTSYKRENNPNESNDITIDIESDKKIMTDRNSTIMDTSRGQSRNIYIKYKEFFE